MTAGSTDGTLSAVVESKRRGFRPDIQGMRAIAVIAVALNHARVPGFGGGYVGVDVFFVISGFLITGWLLRRSDRPGRPQLAAFYAARARRILPAATLTLVAVCAAAYLLLNQVRALGVYHDAIWCALFLSNVHFAHAGTDYFQHTQPPSLLQHYWSLAVEEQFYLVWPALLAGLLFVARGRRGVVAGGLAVGCSLSLWWSIRYTATNPTAGYFSSLTRAWELGVGALLSIGWSHAERLPLQARRLVGWGGLAAVTAAIVAFSSGTEFPGYAALLPVLGTAALLAANGAGPGRIVAVRPLAYSGDISYSFYLWHWPFLMLAADRAAHPLSIKGNLVLLALAYAVSALTYRLFENPLRHAGTLTRAPWRALTLWPVTVGAVVAIAVLAISTVPAASEAAVSGAVVVSSAKDAAIGLVAAAVKPSHLKAKIKLSVLIPPVASLPHDHFPTQGCDAGVGSATTERICHWGDTSAAKTMVLFGDSHAQMWGLPLTYFAASNGWQLIPLMKPGCIGSVLWGVNAPDPQACKGWYAWAKNELRQLSPDAIVFAAAYTPYRPALAASIEAGMRTAITSLQTLAPKLVVLQDTTYFPIDPTDCLLKPKATFGSCTFPPAAGSAAVDAAVRTATTGARGTFLPTRQWMCAHGKCPMVIGSTIAYINRNHISQEFARQLKTPFANELGTALR